MITSYYINVDNYTSISNIQGYDYIYIYISTYNLKLCGTSGTFTPFPRFHAG